MNHLQSLEKRILKRKMAKPEPPIKYCSYCEMIMPKHKQKYCCDRCQYKSKLD